MARLDEHQLADIARQEVAKYAGTSPHAQIYFIADDNRHIYAITGIENEPGANHSWIILQARVADGFIVIDEDTLWDKNLWKALVQAGVPREQIVLAYLGESLPVPSET